MKPTRSKLRRPRRLAPILALIPVGLLCLAASGTAAQPTGSADLQVTATPGANSVPVGGTLGYTIQVVDLGPETATGVTVEDALPSNVEFVSATSTTGSCALQGQKVICSVGTLEAGPTAKVGSDTISLVLRPLKAGTITNTVAVRGDQGDPVPGNNQASVTTQVLEGPKTTPNPPSKPASPGGTAYCRGVRATIVGTPGNDVLTGTRGRDVIVAFGGNDRILAYGGRDLICAGNGADYVAGGPGSDRVFAGAGKDRLLGAAGPDLLKGQAGNDVLKGGAGADRIRGGRGFDRCRGGAGRDSIRGCER